MKIRDLIRGKARKPFVVVWNEMDNCYRITTKTNRFRTAEVANAFIRTLPYRAGFVRINHIYCVGNRPLYQAD